MNFQRVFRGRTQSISAAVLGIILFTAGFAAGNSNVIGAAQSNNVPSAEVEAAFAPFWQTFNLIESDYIGEVELQTLVDGATTGLVDALDDPFSGYMSPDVFDMMNADLEGEIEGIGVVIRTDEETNAIEVVGVIEGSPAQATGILRGDVFVEVDGQSVADISQMELAGLVRGPEGTSVTIIMLRDEEAITFEVTRARIAIENVETAILEGDIAYLRLNQFSANARAEMDAALETLDVNSRNGLVFDLRDNPGGLLSASIDIASVFIEEGVIVTESFGDTEDRVFNATGEFANIEVPIVVLVNEGSASASELVAGAIQDTGAATLIGQTTFGKGTVQTWHALENGGGVRLTIARWLTPSGEWIHENGITPDYVIEWLPEDYLPEPDPAADPQLAAALEFIETGSVTLPLPAADIEAE